MTMTVRQRKKIMRDMLDLFIEQGKVLTPDEYNAIEDRPHKMSRVRNGCGSWSRMLARMKTAYPEEFESIGSEVEGGFKKDNFGTDQSKDFGHKKVDEDSNDEEEETETVTDDSTGSDSVEEVNPLDALRDVGAE